MSIILSTRLQDFDGISSDIVEPILSYIYQTLYITIFLYLVKPTLISLFKLVLIKFNSI